MQTFNINTLSSLSSVVEELIPKIQYPIIYLKGNLGAGKTTFSKEFCKQLGVTDEVSSPTYAIVNEYHTKNKKIFHFDLYRMKSPEEVYNIGMFDYLDSGNLCIIEWPEIFESEITENHHEICIFSEENNRILIFK